MALTQSRLKSLLNYDQTTGIFIWSVNRRGTALAGTVAGNACPKGYICIKVDGRLYKAHRLAWLYMTGIWPPDQIDHRDLNKSNNRWLNLRPATNAQNRANSRVNKTLPKGVSFDRDAKAKPYISQIKVSGKRKYLGRYASAEEAHSVYCRAAVAAKGEFARFA